MYHRNNLIKSAKKYKVHVQSINDKTTNKPLILAVGPGYLFILYIYISLYISLFFTSYHLYLLILFIIKFTDYQDKVNMITGHLKLF